MQVYAAVEADWGGVRRYAPPMARRNTAVVTRLLWAVESSVRKLGLRD